MNTALKTAALAFGLVTLTSAPQAATFHYGYSFDGSAMVLDSTSANPANQSLTVGDTLVLDLKAQANKAWHVDATYTSVLDAILLTQERASRRGTYTVAQSLGGVAGASDTRVNGLQAGTYVGANFANYTIGDLFDAVSITYTLLDDDGSATTLRDGLFPVWGTGFWANSNVSYVDYAGVAAVPLPAAGWVFLAGLGGLAALRRRKKAA